MVLAHRGASGCQSGFCSMTRPSSPGRMTMNGTAILKNEPMTGAMRAARRLWAASTRCTTRKSVVQ